MRPEEELTEPLIEYDKYTFYYYFSTIYLKAYLIQRLGLGYIFFRYYCT